MVTLQPCQNKKEDARIAFAWRNDPATVASSYITIPKSWNSFWLEYNAGYFENPPFDPVFVIESSEPVGFIRFEPASLPEFSDQTVIEVMINIAPHRRGEGIGTEALIALQDYMRKKNVTALIADIRKGNLASLNAFEKAGFAFFSQRTEYIAKTKENCCILCYLCRL